MGPDRRILPDGLTNSSSPPPLLVPHPGYVYPRLLASFRPASYRRLSARVTPGFTDMPMYVRLVTTMLGGQWVSRRSR